MQLACGAGGGGLGGYAITGFSGLNNVCLGFAITGFSELNNVGLGSATIQTQTFAIV